jgi:hypothetical protein
MKTDRNSPRLPLNIPGLESYLLDGRGSLWRHRGERSGSDKRLSSISFAACMRRIGRKYASHNLQPWPLLPGVWIMLHATDIPEDVSYSAHIPIDQFFRAHCFGRSRQHPEGWPTWSVPLHDAAAEVDAEGLDAWYCLSDVKRDACASSPAPTPVAILAPLAFLALSLSVNPCVPWNDRHTRVI